MTTKRIKLPQRSKAPGELRYKLWRCGLPGYRALGAASSAIDCVRVGFPGVVRCFGRSPSDRVAGAHPVRRESRSTASRRQLSSCSIELNVDSTLAGSVKSTASSIAVWDATTSPVRELSAPGQQPSEQNPHTRLKKQSSVAGVGADVASATASTGICAATRASAASTGVCAAASTRTASTSGARRAASTTAAGACRSATGTTAARAAPAAGTSRAARARRAARAAVIAAVVAASVRSGETQRAD